jgi:hypothetical protein
LLTKASKHGVTKGAGPRSHPVVILEKESSTRASTRVLVLPEAPERRVEGKLDLQEAKGTCVSFTQGLLKAQRVDSAQELEDP